VNVRVRLRHFVRNGSLVIFTLSSFGGVVPDLDHLYWNDRFLHAPLAFVGLGLFWGVLNYALGARRDSMGMVKE